MYFYLRATHDKSLYIHGKGVINDYIVPGAKRTTNKKGYKFTI